MKTLTTFTRHLLIESIPPICFWLLIALPIGAIGLAWAVWGME